MPEEMPFSYEEIQKLRELLEVEAIRKLRNLYAHLLDSGDIDALAALFTEDAVCEFGPYGEWHGRERSDTTTGRCSASRSSPSSVPCTTRATTGSS